MTGALLAFRDDTPQIAKDKSETYLARVPGHRAARRPLAVAHLRLGNPSEARRLLDEACQWSDPQTNTSPCYLLRLTRWG